MQPKDEIAKEGFALEIGRTISMLCPFCEGGGSKEISLSVTRDSKYLLLYKCHRAKCGKPGAITCFGAGIDAVEVPVRKFTPNMYNLPVEALEIQDLEFITEKWKLDIEDILSVGWAKASKEHGFLPLILPVFSPTGACRGHVLRIQPESDAGKKEVRSYKILDEPWCCWYRSLDHHIVVVEDQISALRASEFCTSVALLGVNASEEKMEEIFRQARGRSIWLAFDKDATGEAFKYLKRYRAYCPNLNVLMLPKDIKNMTTKEIKRLGGPFA
jgi:hypothetical protein